MASGFIKSLGRLSTAAYIAELIASGSIPPIGVLQVSAMKHVVRLSELPGGSPQFLGAKAAAIQSEARGGMLNLARRAAQQSTTVETNTKGPEQEYIWITEADDSTCDPCMSNAALIKTINQWIADGLPGASTCEGGDRCRCDLFPVD
jgi:hypothetical protein